ncbi:hypothetical protein Tco_1000922 [Tanacetum coccineum]
MSSSTVTYTFVYTDSEPWRFYGGSNEEPSDVGSLRVIVYKYDGLPMHPVAPPSSDYMPGPVHLPSPDYMLDPKHPPTLVYIPKPEYPEYLAPSGDEAPIEDPPLPNDASPTALSSGYVANSNLEEDPEEDPEEDQADYPTDRGDDDESSDYDDDDDADDEDEEASEDEDNNEEEEEHLAPADSSVIPGVDPVPSVGDTEAFETNESAPTPPSSRSPQIISEVAKLLTLPTPPPSLLTPLSSPLPHIPSPPLPVSSPPLTLPLPTVDSPTYAKAPLGYRVAMIRMRAASPPLLLPSTSYRDDIPEAKILPRKRACFLTPTFGFKVGESLEVGAARQPRTTLEADLRQDRVREMGYRITDTWDEIVEAMLEIALTTLDGSTRVNRPYHRRTAMLLDREATYACRVWTASEDRSAAIEAHVRTLEAQTLEARDLEPQDEPAEAGSSCVATALAECDTDRSRNGNDSHDSGTGRRKHVFNVRECTYTDFLKCQPMNFKGTEGVVGLTQWLEKMNLFSISATALSHVRSSLQLLLFKEMP